MVAIVVAVAFPAVTIRRNARELGTVVSRLSVCLHLSFFYLNHGALWYRSGANREIYHIQDIR